MSELPSDVARILAQAHSMNEGPVKIELLQEGVRLADRANDIDAGFQSRLALQEAALTCGSADVLLVAYTWCLAQAEAHPERFSFHQVLWRYRWAIIYLPTFPEIPRTKIEDALADMTARYERANASLRPVHLLRWKVAIKLGDHAMASEARGKFQNCHRDWLSDDLQTELVTQIDDRLFHDRWAEAVELAKPFLDGGSSNDGYLDTVLSWLPIPLLRLGRVREAMAVHERGIRLTLTNAALVTQAARHMQFLALTHNFPQALRLAERYLPYCANSDPEDKAEFYPSMVTLAQMLRRSGKESVPLRLTPDCPGYVAAGIYPLAQIEAVYRREASEIFAKYDARNGNNACMESLNSLDRLLELARPHPVSVKNVER